MVLKELEPVFSVCKVENVPAELLKSEYCFVGKTDEELSLVCASEDVPEGALIVDPGWKGLRIEGVLDFSMIGVLSKLSAVLAEAEIGIFVVSTYNTDYILVKEENFVRAKDVLSTAGYEW